MTVFGVTLVRIFPTFRLNTERYELSLLFSSNAGKCGKNADKNNSKYRHFLPSVNHRILNTFLDTVNINFAKMRNSEFKILSKKKREWKYNLRGINSQLPMTEFYCEKQLKGIGLILNYTTTQNEPKRHKASQNDQKET